MYLAYVVKVSPSDFFPTELRQMSKSTVFLLRYDWSRFFIEAGSMFRRGVSSHISQDISFSRPTIFQAVGWMSFANLFVESGAYNDMKKGYR
ncbi:hypothetical protein OROMI_017200 [Orobanche minor]